MKQLGEILKASKDYVASYPQGRPKREVEEFIAATLAMPSRLDLYVYYDKPLSEIELSSLRPGIRRLAQGEPVAYILGQSEFYGHPFAVSYDVLIPRPETELLVDIAIREIDLREKNGKRTELLDICTGSGCVGISVKKQRPHAQITLSDISPAALEIASKNATSLSADVQIVASDLFKVFCSKKTFDIILANPPYLSSQEWEHAEYSVRTFEPKIALDGGSDGLRMYERVARDVGLVLNPEGFFACEIGERQGEQVMHLFRTQGFSSVQVHKDLQGRNRFVTFRRC